MTRLVLAAAFALVLLWSDSAAAQTVTVQAGFNGSGRTRDDTVTKTAIAVEKGDAIRFTATGTVFGKGTDGPSNGPAGGASFSDPDLPLLQTGSAITPYGLIAVIDDGSGDYLNPVSRLWFGVGPERQIVADRDGTLSFAVWDALFRENYEPVYDDNSGSFTVEVALTCPCGRSRSRRARSPGRRRAARRRATDAGARVPGGGERRARHGPRSTSTRWRCDWWAGATGSTSPTARCRRAILSAGSRRRRSRPLCAAAGCEPRSSTCRTTG